MGSEFFLRGADFFALCGGDDDPETATSGLIETIYS
jgi:hypothetical protein